MLKQVNKDEFETYVRVLNLNPIGINHQIYRNAQGLLVAYRDAGQCFISNDKPQYTDEELNRGYDAAFKKKPPKMHQILIVTQDKLLMPKVYPFDEVARVNAKGEQIETDRVRVTFVAEGDEARLHGHSYSEAWVIGDYSPELHRQLLTIVRSPPTQLRTFVTPPCDTTGHSWVKKKFDDGAVSLTDSIVWLIKSMIEGNLDGLSAAKHNVSEALAHMENDRADTHGTLANVLGFLRKVGVATGNQVLQDTYKNTFEGEPNETGTTKETGSP